MIFAFGGDGWFSSYALSCSPSVPARVIVSNNSNNRLSIRLRFVKCSSSEFLFLLDNNVFKILPLYVTAHLS